jgi:hypothetical protein
MNWIMVRDDRLHVIDECLSEDWVETWAGEVGRQIEEYLGKHAAFEAFLEGVD